MKVFITGATGFIGKHLVEFLKSKSHQVIVNLHSNNSPFDDSAITYKLEKGRIENDIEFFKKEQFDGIIHLASLYKTNHTFGEVNDLINSNVRFGSYVLECAVKAKIKWFLNTGTFWQHYQSKKYSPVNLYAATKQAFETIAQYYIDTNQILFNTLKLSDTYGPNDTRLKVFNLWDRISETNEILEMSPGEQIIDVCHVYDIVNAFKLLALQMNENKTENGECFAVKAKERYSLKELSNIFEKATGKILNIKWGARVYRDREVMVPWENGKVVPGWSPEIDIEKGFKLLK